MASAIMRDDEDIAIKIFFSCLALSVLALVLVGLVALIMEGYEWVDRYDARCVAELCSSSGQLNNVQCIEQAKDICE